MSMKVCMDDVAFINQKYDFQQDLEYLPLSFKQEADQFLHSNGLQVELDSAKEIYTSLTTYFEP